MGSEDVVKAANDTVGEKVEDRQHPVGIVTAEMQQSSSEDGVLPYSQEASVLSFPPTPPCQPQLPVSYPGNQQVPEPTESPSQVSSSLGQRLQRFGSNLQIRHVNKQQLQQVLFLGAISYAVYFVHPVFINQVLSFSTGCSRGLVGHLRSLGMLGHASSLCQKGYNRLSDLVYISEHQYATPFADTVCTSTLSCLPLRQPILLRQRVSVNCD